MIEITTPSPPKEAADLQSPPKEAADLQSPQKEAASKRSPTALPRESPPSAAAAPRSLPTEEINGPSIGPPEGRLLCSPPEERPRIGSYVENQLLCSLVSEIKHLRKEINEIKNSNKKMDLHIDFIERIYEKLKYPIIYISSMFNKNYATLTSDQTPFGLTDCDINYSLEIK